MQKRLPYLFFSFLMLVQLQPGRSQDPQFSQFYSSPIYLAPSFAGTYDGGRVIVNFRDQWPALAANYNTYALSADYYFSKFRSGVGLLFLRDDAGKGLMDVTNAGLNYSFNFNITRNWKFRPGLQVYYYWKNIDYNSLLFGDQIARGFNSGSTSGSSVEMSQLLSMQRVRHFDFTTSLLAYSDQYWIGFTLDHLMYFSKILSEQGDYLPLRYSFFGGGKFMLKGKTRKVKEESISLAFNFLSQDKIKYLDLGTYYTLEPVSFGLWFRGLPVFPDNPNLGAITLLFSYKLSSVKIGYSFDFTTSKLITKTGGSHEISLIYYFQPYKFKKIHRALPCPSI